MSETEAEILAATRRALCRHGYADLTVQCIADEASMTTAAIHYHFETKEELLNAVLADLLDRFETELACEAGDPGQRLAAVLDVVFPDEHGDEFLVALMELKAQAPCQETYRERFVELDERMRTVVATVVSDGIEAGQFESVDPERVARTVTTLLDGGHVRMVALDEEPAPTRAVVESYLATQLGWQPEGSA
jgi:AcrR family transcriptional regulator